MQGRKLEILQSVFPYLLIGWIASLMMAGKVNTLMMGEDVAKGLGQRTILMKSFVLLIIVLLSGGSVAVAGPIGFIGIITPHFARFLVGVDHRWRVPYSGLLGAILLILGYSSKICHYATRSTSRSYDSIYWSSILYLYCT